MQCCRECWLDTLKPVEILLTAPRSTYCSLLYSLCAPLVYSRFPVYFTPICVTPLAVCHIGFHQFPRIFPAGVGRTVLCLAPFWEVTGKNPTYVLFFFFFWRLKLKLKMKRSRSGQDRLMTTHWLVSRNTCMLRRWYLGILVCISGYYCIGENIYLFNSGCVTVYRGKRAIIKVQKRTRYLQ